MKARFPFWRNLLLGLIRYGRIETTFTRAKAIQGPVERLVVQAKKKTLISRRQVRASLGDKKIVNRLVDEIAPKFGARQSGFTRIIKIGRRKGDGAMMVKIEFVDFPEPKIESKIKAKPSKSKTKIGKVIKKL